MLGLPDVVRQVFVDGFPDHTVDAPQAGDPKAVPDTRAAVVAVTHLAESGNEEVIAAKNNEK